MRIIKNGSSDPPSLPYWNSPFTHWTPSMHTFSCFGFRWSFSPGIPPGSRQLNFIKEINYPSHTISSRFHSHFHYYLLFKSHQKWVCFLSVPLTKMKEVLGEFSLMVSRLLLHSLVSPLFILLRSGSIVSWYQKLLLHYWLPSNVRLVYDSCHFLATLDGKAKLLSGDIGWPLPEYTTNKK